MLGRYHYNPGRMERGLCGFVVALIVVGWVGVAAQAPPAGDVEGRASAAMQALQSALIGRLRAEMERGGPVAAVTVCRDEAQAITARVAKEQGIALGRTSHRLRSPANAPAPWMAAAVVAGEGRKASEVQAVVVDLGDRVGVMRPIGTMEMCTSCHGPADEVKARLGGALATAYPEDRATGFAVGDLRGWMWAEVPKDASGAPGAAGRRRVQVKVRGSSPQSGKK
jgi:hypothetical protein